MSGIGSHHAPNKGATDDWLTPPEILDALGPFDLDPCASENAPWKTALTEYTIQDDGLSQEWGGFVWCNPPYGPGTWKWLARLAEHGDGIALVFARTETKGFFREVWGKADSLFFLEGRLFFHFPVTGERAKHNSGAPSVLVGYGREASLRLATARLKGSFVAKWELTP